MWSLRSTPLRHRTARAAVPPPRAEDAETERPASCGWFDSSHELQRGLCVRELAEPAQLARELPLPAWLDLQRAACTATHSAAYR